MSTLERFIKNTDMLALYGLPHVDLAVLAQKKIERHFIDIIQQAGPMMVVDPEKAAYDLPHTVERTRIAAEMGMQVILMGGSTDNGEAQIVVPALRQAIDVAGAKTLIVSFPGSSRQIVDGIHVNLLLDLPQIAPVFQQNPALKKFFEGQRAEIIQKCEQFNIPQIPTKYIIFSAGKPTSVEKATGIQGIDVRNGLNVTEVMKTVSEWCEPGSLVFLELGSAPEQSISLAPLARAVYELTSVIPIISGGINTAAQIANITESLPHPVGFGSLAEKTNPDQFPMMYQNLISAHPLYRSHKQ